AVFFQYPKLLSQAVLLPIAFTMEATQDGPPPSFTLAWSEFWPEGITQLTERRLHAAISVNTSTGFRSTLADQSFPVHSPPSPLDWQICWIALGAVQIEPALGA